MSTQTLTVKLSSPHRTQQQVIREATRFNVVNCGRRWGKTELLIERANEPMIQGYPIGWFAPTYKILADAWRRIKDTFKEVIVSKNETEKRIELITGGSLEAWTLEDEDAGRGRKYKRVLCDEIAKAPKFKTAWENAIRPTLTDLGGDAYFGSTPRGRNYFFDIYGRGIDPEQEDWMSWTFPTSANPYIDPAEIEAARRELPERVFAQEYLAEFIESEGSVFRNVDACMVLDTDIPGKHRGHRVVIGADWGKMNDFTTFSVFCADCAKEVQIDRFNQIDYIIQRERLRALDHRWKAKQLLVERNSAEANLEMLQKDIGPKVKGFTMTASNKPGLVTSLAVALEKEEAKWIDDPVWTDEMIAFQQKTNPNTGRSTYSAPEGRHDDTVIARCLSWRAATTGDIWAMTG